MLVFEGVLSPSQCDKVREMMVDGYSAAEIMAAIQPPIHSPWRWHRDPLVIGAFIGLAILLTLFFSVIP